MNILNTNHIAYKEYKNKVDLNNLQSKLIGIFNKDFYSTFLEIVFVNLSSYYKKEFAEELFKAIFNGNKNYEDNLKWMMDLFKEYDLINISNNEKLLSILLHQESNTFNSYNDLMIIKREFPDVNNFKDRIFLITNDKDVINSVLNSIEDFDELNAFKIKINKVRIAVNYIGINGRIYDFDENKMEVLEEREIVIKALSEKEQIKSSIDTDLALNKGSVKKRI